MASSVLFSNHPIRNINKNLIEFKAGKMIMKGNMIHPDNRKGQLYIYQSDDSLMHFCWRDRLTGVVEDDLIIFPDDCEFKHVSQCKTGRVYLLRFKSSNRKFFFWLQDQKCDKDDERCRKINELLNNPPIQGNQRNNSNPEGDLQNLLNNMSQQQLMQLFGGVGQIGGFGSLLGTMNRPYTGTRSNPPSSSSTVVQSKRSEPIKNEDRENSRIESIDKGILPSDSQNSMGIETSGNDIKLSDFQSFLTSFSNSKDTNYMIQRELLEELSKLILSSIPINDNLESLMKPFLPPGDLMCATLSSPQLIQAFSMFWITLHSGQMAGIFEQFSFPLAVIEAANSGDIGKFIDAIETNESLLGGLQDSRSNTYASQGFSNKEDQEKLLKRQENDENSSRGEDDEEKMNLD